MGARATVADRPLLAAELPYATVAQSDWPRLLARLRQLGATAVVAPLPWASHEPQPGVFDFSGQLSPATDLLGFVALCGRLGLPVLLNPGPATHPAAAGSVPGWLVAQQPAVFTPQACGLEPGFLAAARRWLAAVASTFAHQQYPAGPLLALQLASPLANPQHPYLLHEVWPRWLHHMKLPTRQPAGQHWAAFSDWYAAASTSALVHTLRAAGWHLPILLVASLEKLPPGNRRMAALARASGWVGFQAASLPSRDPQIDGGAPRLDFARYVSQSYCAPALANQLSGDLPALASFHTPPPDLALGAVLLGGSRALALAGLIDTGNPATATLPPLRRDGSPRAQLWQIRVPLLLLGAAGSDWARARQGADMALGVVRPVAAQPVPPLASALAQAGISFVVLDLEAASAAQLAAYKLVVVPPGVAAPLLTRAALAEAANLLHATPASDANQLAELVEARGGVARYAWADAAELDLRVAYGQQLMYLTVSNRRPTAYSGLLGYRAANGDILHLHLRLGGLCSALVVLHEDEVLGVAAGGNGADGGWLVRGAHTSMVYTHGGGVVAPCGSGLLLSAAESGQFQLRRPAGWGGLNLYRLLLDGRLLAASCEVDASHMVVAYTTNDAFGPTDLYILLPPEVAAPPQLQAHLATLLIARAVGLERAAALAQALLGAASASQRETLAQVANICGRMAIRLVALAQAVITLAAYSTAWQTSDEVCAPLVGQLAELALPGAGPQPQIDELRGLLRSTLQPV